MPKERDYNDTPPSDTIGLEPQEYMVLNYTTGFHTVSPVELEYNSLATRCRYSDMSRRCSSDLSRGMIEILPDRMVFLPAGHSH